MAYRAESFQRHVATGYGPLIVLLQHQCSDETDYGCRLDVLTTEREPQLYTGNMLQGTAIGKGGRIYRMSDGIALEPQKFPDTPNRPSFGSARVDPGETYRHIMIYRPSVIP